MNIAIILDETWNSSLTFFGKAFLDILKEDNNTYLLCQKDSYIDNVADANKFYIQNLRTLNPLAFFKNLNSIRGYLNKIKPHIVITIRGDATFYACLLKKHVNFKLIRIIGEAKRKVSNRHCIDYAFVSTKKFENLLNMPHRIVNGVVDTNKFTFKPDCALKIRKEFGIDNDTFLYGFIGRTSPVKGIFMLLEAFAKLDNKAKLFLLTYETEIKINDIMQKAKQLNIHNRIIIENRFRHDVECIISTFDVGIVSSVGSEVIARTVLEYLACSKACIVTDVGCLAEVVDDSCGILCKPNVDSLYKAMVAIQQKDLVLMSKSALNKSKMFSIQYLKDAIFDALKQINTINTSLVEVK